MARAQSFASVQCHPDLGAMTMGKDKLLGHEQQLSEVLSTSNLPMKIIDPDTNFCHSCTLTLEIWLSVKVLAILWIIPIKDASEN